MTISAIQRHDPPANIGHLERAFFLFQKDVTGVPTISDIFNTNVVLRGFIGIAGGSSPLRLYFTPRSERFVETSKITKHGKRYEVTLTLEVPKDRAEVSSTLQAISNNKVLITYKDRNGQIKIIQNLRLEDNAEVGSGNKYRLTFRGTAKKKAKFWETDDWTNGFTGGESSQLPDGFTGGGTTTTTPTGGGYTVKYIYHSDGITNDFAVDAADGTLLVLRNGVGWDDQRFTFNNGILSLNWELQEDEYLILIYQPS